MTLGEKIKKARKAKRITQSQLSKDKITRNMISRIENGQANPSLETIRYISKELSLPVSYFMSEDDDLFFYEKAEIIKTLYRAFEAKEYDYCISKINELSGLDNELALMLVLSHYELGKVCVMRGSFSSAVEHIDKSLKYSDKTVFNTEYIRAVLALYKSIAVNVRAPLLEFESDVYKKGLINTFDYELYKYVILDFSYSFTDPIIAKHIKAKEEIKKRNYQEAINILTEAEDLAKSVTYNAFIVFGIYTDLEHCYKQLYNFENAYKYSSKRMSMLEGFKS